MVDHPSGKQKTLWEAERPSSPGGVCSASAAAPPVPTRVPRCCFHLGEARQARTWSPDACDAEHPRSRPRRRVSPPRVSPRQERGPGAHPGCSPRGGSPGLSSVPAAVQSPPRAPRQPRDAPDGMIRSGAGRATLPAPFGSGSPGTPSPARPEPRSPPGRAGRPRDAAAHCSRVAEDVKEHPDGGIKQELLCMQRDRLHSGNYWPKKPNKPKLPPRAHPQTNKK